VKEDWLVARADAQAIAGSRARRSGIARRFCG